MRNMFFIFVLALTSPCLLHAEQAVEIIREMDRQSDNGPARMVMDMDVYDDATSTTGVRSFSLVTINKDEHTSYMEFSEPRSVKGLKILSSGGDNWVYFPSTGRVRKISGSSRRGSVQGIGGDFSYEDLSYGDWEKRYAFTIVKTTEQEWVLEGRAVKPEETYEKVVISVHRDIVRPRRIEFYTRADGLLKILEFSGYAYFSGKLEAKAMVMRNVKKNSKTEIRVISVSYGISPDARYFEPNRFYK
jgi:hypothetical protein